MFKAPKVGKGVSSVKKKTSLLGKKGSRKSIYGGVGGAPKGSIKGKNILKGTGKKIGPIRPDLKQGGVRKINRLVETRVQNLVPKLSEKIEAKVDSFDPNKFMGKIFDGGLDSLRGFGSSLDGMKGSMQKTVDFLKEATDVASTFISKLAKAKQKKGGGLIGGLLKGVALAGVAALAAPTIAKVALFGGMAAAGTTLWKKGIDFIKGRFKKKKKEKKKKETKAKKQRKNLFRGVLEKFHSTLDFLNPLKRSMKGKGEPEREDKSMYFHKRTTDGKPFGERTDQISVYDTAKSDQIFTLKIDSKAGKVLNGNELQQQILTKQGQISEKKFNNKWMKAEGWDNQGNSYDDTIAQNEKDIARLKEEIKELVMTEGSGATSEKRVKTGDETPSVEGMVQKGEQGEKGVEGKKGGLGGFIQNTTKNVKNIAGKIVKSTPQYKLFNIVKENKENIKKISKGVPVLGSVGAPKKKGGGLWGAVKGAAGWLGGGIKGMVDSALGLRKDNAKAIAQPAKKGVVDGGEGGIVPIKIGKRKDSKGGTDSVQQVKSAPANKVPSLLSMDRRNLHTPYAKSTFNIVDAL